MYTASQDQDGHWDILDPDGDIICTLISHYGVETLLSHLNR